MERGVEEAGSSESPPDIKVSPSDEGKKTASRQWRSCTACRARKVKCDRVQPCAACCAHGRPSQCVFVASRPGEEFKPISQSEEIRRLRAEVKKLKTMVTADGNPSVRTDTRLAELKSVIDSIRNAPEDEIDDLVLAIRSGHRPEEIDDSGDAIGPPVFPESEGQSSHKFVHDGPAPRGQRTDFIPESSPNTLIRRQWYAENIGRDSQKSEWERKVKTFESFPNQMSELPAVEIFVDRFLDAFSPEVNLDSGRAGALRAAAGIRMFSPLLRDAFQAVSITFFGQSTNDKRIEASGYKFYSKTLAALQKAILNEEQNKSEATIVTVVLLMAFESLQRTGSGSVSTHAEGAVRLFKYRGPYRHMYGVEHLLFTELRPYWVAAALVARRPSFFAEEEWKTIPWSAGSSEKDILHHLLDQVVEIPGVLAQYDKFMQTLNSGRFVRGEITSVQAMIWTWIADIDGRLRKWIKEWVETYPNGRRAEVMSQGKDPFPIFRCRDLRTMQIITPTTFVYPDLKLAQTMCVYYASHLILSSVDTRPTGGIPPQEKYMFACNMCRSIEYYIRNAPGNMINRLAFPLRVGFEALPHGDVERQYMVEVFRLVEERHFLKMWGSTMPEISPRKNSPEKNEEEKQA